MCARITINGMLAAAGRKPIDAGLADTDFANHVLVAIGQTAIPPFATPRPATAYLRLVARCWSTIAGAFAKAEVA